MTGAGHGGDSDACTRDPNRHALNEVLADPTVASQLADTKAAAEVRVMKEFREMLNSDPDRAVYGPKHVLLAQQQDAIQKLMVTDELFRSSDLKTRQHYVKLVESVRASGGEVHVFSNLHVSGERTLVLVGGVGGGGGGGGVAEGVGGKTAVVSPVLCAGVHTQSCNN